jgi:hypothetical protein
MRMRAGEHPHPYRQRRIGSAFIYLLRISVVAGLCPAALVRAQSALSAAPGLAWNVKGTWHVAGMREPLLTGDAIQPGALLEPAVGDSAHSITVLLPDGQSVLYECFTAKDCARGFRAPDLYRNPEPFAVEMLARIRAVLARPRSQAAAASTKQSPIARDEAVAALGPGNRIEIGGLAAKLSNGEYFGDLKSFDARYLERLGIPLQKSSHSIAMMVPGPGLYSLTIIDSRKWPRIEFLIAVEAAQDTRVANNLQKEHALLTAWREEYFGWPVHDFQRAYLESLMLDIRPAPDPGRQVPFPIRPHAGVTAEPTFSPRPGVVAGDMTITLLCATPDAIIHYSVDTSQPSESSPIYHAPIVMKGLPLTIKAFAAAPGLKDSAVVTGDFRIQDRKD